MKDSRPTQARNPCEEVEEDACTHCGREGTGGAELRAPFPGSNHRWSCRHRSQRPGQALQTACGPLNPLRTISFSPMKLVSGLITGGHSFISPATGMQCPTNSCAQRQLPGKFSPPYGATSWHSATSVSSLLVLVQPSHVSSKVEVHPDRLALNRPRPLPHATAVTDYHCNRQWSDMQATFVGKHRRCNMEAKGNEGRMQERAQHKGHTSADQRHRTWATYPRRERNIKAGNYSRAQQWREPRASILRSRPILTAQSAVPKR